jgi:probable rRNA maturation factor
MKQSKILVNLKTYQRKWRIKPNSTRKYLLKIWNKLARNKIKLPAETEMTVVFLNDTQMRRFNRTYRKKDFTTDVLSFPVNETLDQRHYLGDVLISMERAALQADERHRSLDEEVKVLLLHGVLHLLGYDHETDNGQMNRLERQIRKELGTINRKGPAALRSWV